LIVPDGVRGFIDSNTGENRLSTVLVPLDPSEDASPVLDALKLVLGKGPGTIKILNVGEQTSVMGLPEGWKLEYLLREGEPLEEILKELAAAPDLVVMGSRGHDSLKDTLLGSKAEQVLHAVDCPVLISQLVA
jgi:nucleotide-binding universal stress UspA family protein